MEEKLDFSLPKEKQKSPASSRIAIVLLLVLVCLALANLWVALRGKVPTPQPRAATAGAEQTRELATRLAQRNLYGRAARVWQDYLNTGRLTDTQRAQTLFQIGTMLEKAGSLQEAIEYYYRSEAAAKLDELAPQINAHLKDCFERLGKFSALRYEVMDRTSYKQTTPAGGKVIAEIGAEKITEADLDAVIENDIDNQLTPMAAFMSDEQLKEQKKQMLERYKDPEVKHRFLQAWLAQEILYRQALQEQFAEKSEVKKLLDDLARGVLSQQLMNRQLAEKIHVTETDLQTFYAANKDKYIEPAKAKISHILATDEQQAGDLLKRIRAGDNFAETAKEFSRDDTTKEAGGKIDVEVTRGSYIPVIGESPELNNRIFAAEPNSVLAEPFETEKGWEIVRVEEKQPERQKTFDEVRQQVMSTLLTQKRQDVQQQYITQMMDKFNVIVHTTALTGAKGESEEKPSGSK